jgi:hypothetical protein
MSLSSLGDGVIGREAVPQDLEDSLLRARATDRQQNRRGEAAGTTQTVTITEALDAFHRDCEARNLSRSTLAKYKLLSRRFKAYCAEHRISRLADLTPPHAGQFRAGWKGSPRTIAKMIERFRACHDRSNNRARLVAVEVDYQ